MTAQPPDWFSAALATPATDDSVQVDGARIRYRAWGGRGARGAVLVHGTAAHARWWDHVAPQLPACCASRRSTCRDTGTATGARATALTAGRRRSLPSPLTRASRERRSSSATASAEPWRCAPRRATVPPSPGSSSSTPRCLRRRRDGGKRPWASGPSNEPTRAGKPRSPGSGWFPSIQCCPTSAITSPPGRWPPGTTASGAGSSTEACSRS